jgi:hypothetical protein
MNVYGDYDDGGDDALFYDINDDDGSGAFNSTRPIG